MKKKHLMGMLAAGAAALLFSTVPAGCTDGRDEIPSTGGRIGFSVGLWKEGGAAQAARTKGAQTKGGATQPDTLPAVSVIALEGDASGDGKPLYLHAVTTDGIGEDATAQNGGARTKASPVDNATMYEEMSVTAFVYPASDSWPSAFTGGSATSYMRTVRVKKSESWNTSYYWPGASRRISFFAVAPYVSPGLTAFNDGASGNPPYLSYTVPAGVADQKDMLVASSTDRPGNTNAAEALAMKHALTAVRFVTGDDMLAGTVSKITLKGVYSTGRLPLQASAAWYSPGGARDFAQTFSPEAVAPDPQVPDTPLTPETATFMMLPQTLPTNAKIEVLYKDKLTNTQRTLTANIAGKTWPMGKTVTYRISTSSIVVTPTLTVTAPAEFEYTGGNKGYTVRSYATVTGGGATGTKPIAWTAEFSEDGGTSWSSTKPAWLTAFTASGTGSTSAAGYTATVAAQTGVVSSPQNTALQAATPVNDGTNANIYDLSTKGGTAVMRTANCYIVNAAGRYKLPLVYGNAVDKVKVPGTGNNTSAYTSQAPVAGNILKTFINHLGNGITDPYIYNNTDCTPDNCTLIWQDEQNLVTDVNLSSDGHFLEFTVEQSTIRQGNAVVAVRNASNTVMWSWHIWVTDYVLGTGDKTITNFQHNNHTFMSVNIGWCDGLLTTYAERTVQVRFKQVGTSATPQIITVKQKTYSALGKGNSTYYQWGRKDPFVGTLAETVNKTWYNEAGTASTSDPPTQTATTGNACIINCIKQPGLYSANRYMDATYINLWSADNTLTTANDNAVVKTIYDPSPVGYKLPPSNIFTGFSPTGQNVNSATPEVGASYFNVSGGWDKGWNFYCGLNKTGDTVYFPVLGQRISIYATRNNVDFSGNYWTAVPFSNTRSRSLYFRSTGVYPLQWQDRGFGFSVKSCQE